MRSTRHIIGIAVGLVATACVQAQVALPGIDALPRLPELSGMPGSGATTAALDDVHALADTRRLQLQALLHDHRRDVDSDPHGAAVVRDVIVAIDPEPVVLQTLQRVGFSIAGDATLDALQLHVVSLRAPPGTGTRDALALADRVAPGGHYDFDHLYWRSGAAQPGGAPAAQRPAAATPRRFMVGLIDSGIDATHPALAGTDVKRWGCDGRAVPDAHGTEVASLLAGGAVAGERPGATLYAADVYCGQPTGGSAVAVVQALAWLAREHVGVINISLVGPSNALLAKAIAAVQARGHVVVAAVGNDGPAAPALYPASYPGVVGVSAVNAHERVLPEAGRGPQVDFVAPGADMVAAAPGGRWQRVRGTSFAAPLVARLAAQAMSQPGNDAATAALAGLARQAVLPPGGRSEVYGHGIVGATLPIARAPAD